MRTVLSFFVLVLLVGFQSDQKKDTSRSIPSLVHPVELKVTLGYFDERSIPFAIAGDCSERYAFDTLALRINKMILFTDADTVMMKINYQLLTFKISHSEIHGKQRTDIFSGYGYTIKLISKEIKKIDLEYFIRSATIEISKNGQKKIFQVMGYYGC